MGGPLYLWLQEQCCGPYSEEEIRAYVRESRLLPTQFAWKEGMPEWVPVNTILTDLHPEKPASPGLRMADAGAFDGVPEVQKSPPLANDPPAPAAAPVKKSVPEKPGQPAPRDILIQSLQRQLEELRKSKAAADAEVESLKKREQQMDEEIRKLQVNLKNETEIRGRVELESREQLHMHRSEEERIRNEMEAQRLRIHSMESEIQSLKRHDSHTARVPHHPAKNMASPPAPDLQDRIRELEDEKRRLLDENQILLEKARRESAINAAFLNQFEQEMKKISGEEEKK